MIIQLKCKKQSKFPFFSNNALRQHKTLRKLNSRDSPSISFQPNNTIRISMPFHSSNHKKLAQAKFNRNITQSYNNGQQLLSQQQSKRSASADFKPSLQHRKTFGHLRYLLQVIQKKVRAKSIQDTFEQCNYKLDMNIESKKGFKGGKLSQNSLFNCNKYRSPSTCLQKQQTEKSSTHNTTISDQLTKNKTKSENSRNQCRNSVDLTSINRKNQINTNLNQCRQKHKLQKQRRTKQQND